MTRRLDDSWTNWTAPENLGPDINSKLEDLFFNIPANSEYAYYSRGVDDTNTDIFRVKLPIFKNPDVWVVVKGKLVDAKTGQPISAKIIYERLPDGKEVGISQTNPQTGEYEIRLPAGHQYGIRAEAEGHISESQNIDLTNYTADGIVSGKDFRLQPIVVAPVEENTTIALNNIFFDFDKAVLKEASFPELNRIVSLMAEKAGMQVEITGHTCDIGDDQYNMGLSERRARAVERYLVSKGVNPSRINVSFFGETKPVVPNASAEARRKNRRVEFKIVKL
jgi:outer membrane protein OmpA-like peptidoglycan-associated protein